MRDDFQSWVNTVCEQVRFRPDRKGIEKELRIHYEDRCRDLERLHYEPELAAQRSLSAMGNAQEVGRALNRVHKPWLGWLWEGTRVLVLTLAVLAAVTLLGADRWNVLAERTRGELAWEEPPASAARVELEHAIVYAAPGDVKRQPDGTAAAEVRLWFRMRDPLGIEPWRGVGFWLFSYRDERGEVPAWTADPLTGKAPDSRYWRSTAWSWGWTRCQTTVELVLDGPPEWAEISHPLSGRDWVLRVEWEAEQ